MPRGKEGDKGAPPPHLSDFKDLGLGLWREAAAGRNGRTVNIKDPMVPKSLIGRDDHFP